MLATASQAERARLLDGVAGLAEPVFAAATTEPSTDPAYGTLRGLYWLLANAAEKGPLVLAIDDLQWADEPSLRFFHFLAGRLEDMAVGVVVAARPEGSGSGSELLDQLKVDAGPPLLRPALLSDLAVGEVVRARLGPSVSPAPLRGVSRSDAGLAVGDGSALDESGPVVHRLLEEGALATREAPWALAMAITLLATPGVESAVAPA